MTHPLTDDLAEDIAPDAQWAGDIGDTVFRHSDMRKAADWQLKQVKKKVKSNLKVWRRSGYGAGADAAEVFFEEVMQALRPQHPIREEDNQ